MKKVALLQPHSLFASYLSLFGYKDALERMELEVLEVPLPGNQVQNIEPLRPTLPSIEQLMEQECIFSMFHEYTQPWLEALYGFENWQKLMNKVPVVARYDESMDRADLGLPNRVPELLKWAHYHSFPGAQDAEKYKGDWQPFGVETRIFHPLSGQPQWQEAYFDDESASRSKKRFKIGFMGSIYKIRHDYLQRLVPQLPEDVTFQLGNAFVQDVAGTCERESTDLLAKNYREFKIFFCLPPMSRLIVNKVFEVMASGTFVMFPKLPWHAKANMDLFADGKEIVYYDSGYIGQNIEQIKYWLEHEKEREAVALAGCVKVRDAHTLDRLLLQLIRTTGERELCYDNLRVLDFKKQSEPSVTVK